MQVHGLVGRTHLLANLGALFCSSGERDEDFAVAAFNHDH